MTESNLDFGDSSVTGTETVLVAEDDPTIKNYIKYVLQDFGYKILTADDGDEAVKVFNENKDTVHLLLLDVMMPKKNGKEAYEAAKKVMPEIKVLFISGYSNSILEEKGLLVKGSSFVAKPVSPWDLLRKVRKTLDDTFSQ
jgi:DNA-binding response OmpR family regulator